MTSPVTSPATNPWIQFHLDNSSSAETVRVRASSYIPQRQQYISEIEKGNPTAAAAAKKEIAEIEAFVKKATAGVKDDQKK